MGKLEEGWDGSWDRRVGSVRRPECRKCGVCRCLNKLNSAFFSKKTRIWENTEKARFRAELKPRCLEIGWFGGGELLLDKAPHNGKSKIAPPSIF